jgi:hypothetical protein
MIKDLRALQDELKKLKTDLPSPQTRTVNSTAIKEQARSLVDLYFRQVRAALLQGGISDTEPADLDSAMRQLIEFTHKRVNAKKYKEEIKKAMTAAVRLEQLCLISSQPPASLPGISQVDQRILKTLGALVPAAAASYQQAITDLQTNNRLSWRGPATDLREALRETLDHLAPDKDVEAQHGYKKEPDTTGPTMRQKVRFVLSKRGMKRAASATTEDAALTVDGMLGSFVRSIYTRSNVSTHTPTDKNEVLRVQNLVRLALCELLELPG